MALLGLAPPWLCRYEPCALHRCMITRGGQARSYKYDGQTVITERPRARDLHLLHCRNQATRAFFLVAVSIGLQRRTKRTAPGGDLGKHAAQHCEGPSLSDCSFPGFCPRAHLPKPNRGFSKPASWRSPSGNEHVFKYVLHPIVTCVMPQTNQRTHDTCGLPYKLVVDP